MNILPMKLTDVGTDISLFLGDEWIMQQKHDGVRMMAKWDGVGPVVYTNNGKEPIGSAAVKQVLWNLDRDVHTWIKANKLSSVVLDGEIMPETGIYHVFDIVEASGNAPSIELGDSLAVRNEMLQHTQDCGRVRKATTAYTPEQKRFLWSLINAAGVEGAVSKRLSSVYVPSRLSGSSGSKRGLDVPIRTKDWVKHKLVKTADVVVSTVSREFNDRGMVTHGRALLFVNIEPLQDPEPFLSPRGVRSATQTKSNALSPRTELPVGHASLIGKDQTIVVGSVVEVNFLNWTGVALIQPRIVRVRLDKTPADCDISQFAEYSRVVV